MKNLTQDTKVRTCIIIDVDCFIDLINELSEESIKVIPDVDIYGYDSKTGEQVELTGLLSNHFDTEIESLYMDNESDVWLIGPISNQEEVGNE